LTTLGIQAGARIGTVRAFNSTQLKATTDSLTGLSNRRSAEERVRQLNSEGKSFAMVLADLDHFKRLNDSRGHEAGDQALAALCRNGAPEFARWRHGRTLGCEEFALILPQTSASQAQEVVDRIRAKLAENLLAGSIPAFTASFGISDTTMSPRFEELLRMADEALYRAKESGRDRAVIAGHHGSTAARAPVVRLSIRPHRI